MANSSGDEEAVPIEVGDDEVYRRKLLMDGEGMGEARKIDSLMKEFFLFDESEDMTDEQIDESQEKLLGMMAQCEYAIIHSRESQMANERQIREYDAAFGEIESKIIDIKNVIEEKKQDLVSAKNVRKHKLKYHGLANIIADLPDRMQTLERLQVLGEEIEDLRMKNAALERRLEDRAKKLGLVLNATVELKTELKKEEKEEWEDSDSD